jgi:hypothetical protein
MKCVVIPLRKAQKHNSGMIYSGYWAALPPIFGTYNGYQEIEDIVKNPSTEIVEKVFDCTIEEFCTYLLGYSPDKSGAEWEDYVDKHLTFMYIHQNVYEFLIAYKPVEYPRAESFDFGKDCILKKYGFEFIEKDETLDRYTKIYEYKGKRVHSDGTWLKESCYGLKDAIQKLGYPKDISFFRGKESHDLYPIFSIKERLLEVYFIYGMFHSNMRFIDFEDLDSDLDRIHQNMDSIELELFQRINDDKVMTLTCDLITLVRNGFYFSITFEPFKQLVTPQDGEFYHHEVFLKKFAEIIVAINLEQETDRDESDPDECDQWLVQDSERYVGNICYWRLNNNNGYTTDIDKAHVFTKEEAAKICKDRETDKMFPLSSILFNSKRMMDSQYLPKGFN